MDDNSNIATSEATHEDTNFAPEVETQESNLAVDAPEVDEGPALSVREALEKGFADEEAKQEKPEAAPVETVAAEKPVEVPPVDLGNGPKSVKAPASWKPAAREKFEALPPDVQEEVARREYQIDKTLADTANERKLAHEFMQVAQPFLADYQAMNIPPLAAVNQFFQVDKALRVGSPVQKAQLVHKLMKDYGVDVYALAEVVSGNEVQEQPKPGYDPELQARLQRVEQFAQQQQQSVAQAERNQLNSQIDSFANDPKNEFLGDVFPHMVALINAGVAQDLQSAYDQACHANPNVRQVLMDRQQQDKARLAAGNASLPPKGPRNGSGQFEAVHKTRRDVLNAMWDAAESKTRV